MWSYYCLVLGLLATTFVTSFFVDIAVATGAIAFGAKSLLNKLQKHSSNILTTQIYESCRLSQKKVEKHELLKYLKSFVYGQHIAIESIVNAVVGHVNDEAPDKPLVISLHGWTGNGKNYVTNLLLNYIYKNGLNSKFVHQFSGRINFPREDKVEDYKWDLFNWIRNNMSACGYSTFVIDEVDQIPAGVLDPLKAIFDYNVIDKGAHNKCIFILISNIGGENITLQMLEHFRNGIKRESLTMNDFERTLIEIAYVMKGGLKGSSIISSNLIDHYIPFLPLESEHVKLCVKDQFRSFNVLNPRDEKIKKIMNQITWAPKSKTLFSETGCKRIRRFVISELEDY